MKPRSVPVTESDIDEYESDRLARLKAFSDLAKDSDYLVRYHWTALPMNDDGSSLKEKHWGSRDEGGHFTTEDADRVSRANDRAEKAGITTTVRPHARKNWPVATADILKSAVNAKSDLEAAGMIVTATIEVADPTTGDVEDPKVGKTMMALGAVGWYESTTDTITINAPLFSSRKEEEETNAKMEKSHFSSSGHADATLHHELGHAAHAKSSGLDPVTHEKFFSKWESMGFRQSNLAEVKRIAKSVSTYAMESPHEFVAEVISGVLGGKSYGPDVWSLYIALAGPEIKGGRKGEKNEMFRASSPPVLDWVAPPEPMGEPGGAWGGYAASGHTNSEIGDAIESALDGLGLRDLHPGKRQGPLDRGWGNWAFEVKGVTAGSTEYKIKMKASELEGKQKYADDNGLRAGSMIVVLDIDERVAYAYWREGLGNFRLTPGNKESWNFMGKVKIGTLSDVQKHELRNAWEQLWGERDESGHFIDEEGDAAAGGKSKNYDVTYHGGASAESALSVAVLTEAREKLWGERDDKGQFISEGLRDTAGSFYKPESFKPHERGFKELTDEAYQAGKDYLLQVKGNPYQSQVQRADAIHKASIELGVEFFHAMAVKDEGFYQDNLRQMADVWAMMKSQVTSMRLAASAAFDLDQPAFDRSTRSFTYGRGYPLFAEAQIVVWAGVMRREYAETQADIRNNRPYSSKRGEPRVPKVRLAREPLVRGIHGSADAYVSNPIESWSTHASRSKKFGPVLLERTVRPEEVLVYQGATNWALKNYGFGMKEHEFIVLPRPPKNWKGLS